MTTAKKKSNPSHSCVCGPSSISPKSMAINTRSKQQPNTPNTTSRTTNPPKKPSRQPKPNIHYGGERAFYSPEYDFIQMPPKELFKETHEFYGTLTHELIHWTGHQSRLNRLNKLARFGNESYAIEELI